MPPYAPPPKLYLDAPSNTPITRLDTEHPSHRLTERCDYCHSVTDVIEFLDVENSPRYKARWNTTFCNIYACDACDLLGVYLPTVWWIASALEQWRNGQNVPKTKDNWRFVNANGLFDWLRIFADQFGWKEVSDANAAQDEANRGKVVVISAKRRDLSKSGHVSVIVPERELTRNHDGQGNVIPVQTQAGAKNYKMSTDMGAWWLRPIYSGFGFWAAPIGTAG